MDKSIKIYSLELSDKCFQTKCKMIDKCDLDLPSTCFSRMKALSHSINYQIKMVWYHTLDKK